MHLDGFHPDVNQHNTSLVDSIRNFPSLIQTDPVVQTISGAGLALIVIVVIMVAVCCYKSQQCRDGARRCCCWCCNLSQWKETAVGRFRQEKENWAEYQMLRRSREDHELGNLGPGSGARRYRQHRGVRFEEEETDRIASAPARD